MTANTEATRGEGARLCNCGKPAEYGALISLRHYDLCVACYAMEFPERYATFALARVAPHAGEFRDPALRAVGR